jgi:hypothetical protein
MSILQHTLFFGLHVDDAVAEHLSSVKDEILSIFVNNANDYLHEVEHCGKKFIGKYLDTLTSLEVLDLLQPHIYSIIQRILPDYEIEAHRLVVFATIPREKI